MEESSVGRDRWGDTKGATGSRGYQALPHGDLHFGKSFSKEVAIQFVIVDAILALMYFSSSSPSFQKKIGPKFGPMGSSVLAALPLWLQGAMQCTNNV